MRFNHPKLAATIAALLATAMCAPFAQAADTPATTTTTGTADVTKPQSITVKAADTDSLKGHEFTAVELAKIVAAVTKTTTTAKTDTTTESSVTVLTDISLNTMDNVKSMVTDAVKKTDSTLTDAKIGDDPMTYVAKTWSDSDTISDHYGAKTTTSTSGSTTTTAYAGKLRTFVTNLAANGDALTKLATTKLTVDGDTATLTGEPGVYLILDNANTSGDYKANGKDGKAGSDSLPVLAATGVDGITTLTSGTGSSAKTLTLGQVNWKGLRNAGEPGTPEKKITAINGKQITGDPQNQWVQHGDKVSYEITANLPSFTELDGYDGYVLYFKDKLPAGLTMQGESATLDKGLGTEKKINDIYTFHVMSDKDGNTYFIIGSSRFGSSSDLTKQDATAAAAAISQNTNALGAILGHKTITLDYTAMVYGVNSDQMVRGKTGAVNDASIVYTTEPGDWHSTGSKNVPTTATVRTGGFDVMKVHKDGTPVTGDTRFTLTREGDSKPMEFFQFSKPYATYMPYNTESTTTLSTDSKTGILRVDGLAKGRYTLKETYSPVTSNPLLLPSVTITIGEDAEHNPTAVVDASSDKTGLSVQADSQPVDGTVYKDDGVRVTNVANVSQLPRTGLAGALLAAILLLLPLGAGIILTVRNRKATV